MESKKISVIIPVYNCEGYLERCLNSVINQTYKNLEIIIINDGSTDSSGDICKKYAESDSRIIYRHTENHGLSAARNLGLKNASGDFIGFVDSDDYIELNMYERLMNALTENSAQIAQGAIEAFDENGKILWGLGNNDSFNIEGGAAICRKSLDRKEYMKYCYCVTKIYAKELFDGIEFPVGRNCEDAAILHKIYYRCKKMAVIPDIVYHYFIRMGSILHSDNSSFYEYSVPVWNERMSFFSERGERELYLMTLSIYEEKLRAYYVSVKNGKCRDKVKQKTILNEFKNNYKEFRSECSLSLKDKLTYGFFNTFPNMYCLAYSVLKK